ncbi:MAG: ABC transporter permease subunit, partial [Planctomycetota bacterium]
DPEGIHELRQLLIQLSEEQGITILLSSHLLQEVADLCNRIGVLQKGKMLVESTTAELLANEAGGYRLSTADDHAAGEALQAAGMAVQSEPAGGLRLDLVGQDSSRAVEVLVAAGCKLRSFAPVESSLEEIYLAHARGEREALATDLEVDAGKPVELPAQGFPALRVCLYEFSRLARPGTVFALLSPALVAPVVIYQRHAASLRDSAEVASQRLISATDMTAFEVLGRALQTSLPLLALVLTGVASQSLAGQIRSGTLRNLLLRPFHRGEIASGKLAALFAVSSLAYLVLLASAAGAAGMAFEYGDLVEILSTGGGSFPILSATEVWPEFLPALASPLLPLLAFASIGFLISSLTRSSAGALALGLGAVIVLDLGRALARVFDFEALLPGPYLPSPLARNSHVDFFSEFAAGVSNPAEYFAASAQWVPLMWITCCCALASLILRRKYLP